ncbi:MAG: glutamyl-tRNA reductase, partial [Deltaproteobacteria bacterium]
MAAPIDSLVLLGVSHRTAGLAVRERLTRLGENLEATVRSLTELPGISEGMVLSTCNRVELYGAGSAADRAASSLREFLRGRGLEAPGAGPAAGGAREDALFDDGLLYERRGEEAIRHLFRVASSLDSMVVGEPQILGQLKEAFQTATAAGTAGDCLHRTVGRAFAVAKRVRTETDIGRSAVSMSHAAVELAQKIFASLAGRSVLLVGAGEMSALAARQLAGQGVGRIFVANRTLEHAEALCRELDARGATLTAHELEALPELLVQADIVLSAVLSPVPLIDRPMLQRAVRARRFRPLFLVDLAVPRSIAPDAAGLSNVYVKDIDD